MKALIHTLLAGAALVGLAACGGHADVTALDAVGDNADAVVTMNPRLAAASMGAADAAGIAAKLPRGRNFEQARVLVGLEGIDMDCWVSAHYEAASKNVGIFVVRDRSALDKSLGKMGCTKSANGDFDVYSPKDAMKAANSLYYLIDGDYLWTIDAGAAGRAAGILKEIKQSSTAPLAAWKREALQSDAAFNAVGEYNDRNFKINVSLDGNKMSLRADCVDADGAPSKWMSDGRFGHLQPGDAAGLYADDMLSFAVARCDMDVILPLVRHTGLLEMSSAQLAMIKASVAGPVTGSFNMRLPFNSLDDVSARLSVTATNSAAAAAMLAAGKAELARQGIADFVSATANGNVVTFSTPGAPGKTPVPASALDGCIAWGNLNLDSEALRMLAGTDICGINAVAALRDDSFTLDISLPGAESPFLATVFQLINR